MFFTKRQLEQIRQYIAAYGIRTTDFPDTATVTADDYIAIVQGGVNKKVQVSDLFDPELLPSLIVDINVVDEWGPLVNADHTSALSAALGKELKDWQNSFVPVTVYDGLDSTRDDWALSAKQGKILADRIASSLTIRNDLEHNESNTALSAGMGVELNRLVGLRPNLTANNDTGVITASWTNGTPSLTFYTKAKVDALLSGYTPGPGGSTSLSALDDVSLSSLTGGDVLSYDSSSSKWKNVSISSLVSERDILIGSTSIESNALNFVAGTNVNFSVGTVAGVTTLTIGASGGTGGGGGDYYIGNTKAHPTTADPYQLLAGLGSVEILGTGSAYGAKRIYFGSSSAVSPAYIEWDDTNSCFHFSHGLYSDDFVSAGGFNNAGGGTIVASLNDLTDVDTTGAVDGYVLTYNGTSHEWEPKANTGGGTVSQVQTDWNQSDNSAVDFIKNKPVLANVATSGSYNDLSGKPSLATVATTGAYGDLSGKPNLATVATSGNYNDLLYKPSFYALTFGERPENAANAYYPTTSAYTMKMQDLTNIIGVTNDSYIRIGDIKLRYNNGALYCERVTSGAVANFYASGGITAGR